MEPLSRGQNAALEELRRIQDALDDPGSLLVRPFGGPVADGWPEASSPRSAAAGSVVVDIELAVPAAEGRTGPVRPMERVRLLLPPAYPRQSPVAWTVPAGHLAGQPHVLWDGLLCIYESPLDWDPVDGMPGFLTRLESWYEHAALGTLDPVDLPLHPPLESGPAVGTIVVRADAPPYRTDAPLLAIAVLAYRGDDRADLVAWLDDVPEPGYEGALLGRDEPRYLAAAVLLPTPMDFTYPETVGALVEVLLQRTASGEAIDELLDAVADVNSRMPVPPGVADWPAYCLIGSPADRSTGPGRTGRSHLAAWCLEGTDDRDPASWAAVHDARPEMVVRRDAGSPLSWLQDRTVLVLGCGALGAPLAEHCVRAGARRLWLVDDGPVTPGILVRQPYTDADIGRSKVEALAARLWAARPGIELGVGGNGFDLLDAAAFLELPDALAGFDLVIDATANPSVAQALELCRRTGARRGPPTLTVAVGHRARRGIGLLSPGRASGGGWDIMGRLALLATSSRALRDVADDFFPARPADRFRPEPGCSDPTFVGSATEVQGLAAQLLEWAVRRLRRAGELVPEEDAGSMAAYVVRLSGEQPDSATELVWDDDLVVSRLVDGYEVRITPEAVGVFREEALAAAAAGVETGGLLIGRIDGAAMVIWVTGATGPLPDSVLAPDGLYLAADGAAELAAAVGRRHRQRARLLGLWHTHPDGSSEQSPVDQMMAHQLAELPGAPYRSLLLILGGRPDPLLDWLDGAGRPSLTAQLVTATPQSRQAASGPASRP